MIFDLNIYTINNQVFTSSLLVVYMSVKEVPWLLTTGVANVVELRASAATAAIFVVMPMSLGSAWGTEKIVNDNASTDNQEGAKKPKYLSSGNACIM